MGCYICHVARWKSKRRSDHRTGSRTETESREGDVAGRQGSVDDPLSTNGADWQSRAKRNWADGGD